MDLSNKTLGLLLVAAIVISIGGTIISLNRLDGISTTGFATQNDTGQVVLTVPNSLSITLLNNTIDFGSCLINTTQGYTVVDSALNGSGADNDDCSNTGTFPEYLVLDNDGNVNANVSVRTDANGTSMFNTQASWIAYNVINGSEPGCANGIVNGYTNFTSTGAVDYQICDNLTFDNGNDEVNISIKSFLDSTSTSGGTLNLTFVARNN